MKCPFDVVQLSSSVWNVCTWMENGAIFFKEMHEVRNEANAVTYSQTSDRGKWNPKHMRPQFLPHALFLWQVCAHERAREAL